jgi:hypothetical protein
MPLLLPLLLACATAEPAWYSTCGDPACEGYAGPQEGLEPCADQVEGAACAERGAECDLEDVCNTRLVCATEDPKDTEYGCPISRRRHKHDIRYLGPAEVEALRRATIDLPLTTWRYNGSDPAARPRLGFLIDDRPEIPAVAADGEHVDVYGLASMAIATVQAQQSEIAALRREQASLEARLAALEASAAR